MRMQRRNEVLFSMATSRGFYLRDPMSFLRIQGSHPFIEYYHRLQAIGKGPLLFRQAPATLRLYFIMVLVKKNTRFPDYGNEVRIDFVRKSKAAS